MNKSHLDTLLDLDSRYPTPLVCEVLAKEENAKLLDYVVKDPFGCHVFPGDIEDYPISAFHADMEVEVGKAERIHLWAYIPTCRYKCHFCQFPTVILNPDSAKAGALFSEVVDLNIKEAQMWLEHVPSLSRTPVGEFNIFGGTPSLLPEAELRRLMAFYKENFNFSSATLRFEGEPGSLPENYLAILKELGFTKLSFGAQSFNDRLIHACGRRHTAAECFSTLENAKAMGYELITIDLMYGLMGQKVDDVAYDMEMVKKYDLSHVVCTKLHMKEFMETRSGVSAKRKNLWQRKLISLGDNEMPSLGKQYQMRQLVESYLADDYLEHPTMYFHKRDLPPEKWKSLITDLDKQYPEVAIGLGGSSKSRRSEMINLTEYDEYRDALNAGRLPCGSVRGFSPHQQRVNAFKMALSTLIPVDDAVYKKRFDGESFFDNPTISAALTHLEAKGLVTVDNAVVTLSPEGRVLVEAIINTQFETASLTPHGVG
ncbi:radical SAM protein [Lonsdalea quercina]|uniref:radical SAM protein n=1 Tax=Lonsdalea quercina TaxID=71657 RepID=UPI0039761125